MTAWRGAVTVIGLLLGLALEDATVGAQAISHEQRLPLTSSDHAQEAAGEGAPFDIERLFDGDVLSAEEAMDPSGLMTDRAAVEIGGSYRFSLLGIAAWSSLDGLLKAPLRPDAHAFLIDLGANVFLDARPLPDFRVFGRADVSYPFGTGADAVPSHEFDDIVRVKELFSDFIVGDGLSLRGGKHTIAWGVGYFFSPADVLNVTDIDPDEPEAEREGPVSLRANLPLGFDNLYLYVIADTTEEGVQLAVAPKVEVVLGGTEVGIGAYYHPSRVPRAMLTLSTGVLDLDVFGELEGSLGSERRFVEPTSRGPNNPWGLRTVQYTGRIFTAATGGLRYRYTPESAAWTATFVGQYLWNGEGYEDPEILRKQAAGVAALIERGELGALDLTYPGRHYAAAALNLSLGGAPYWSLGALWISNLSDGSGRVSPSLTVRPADQLNLRAAFTITYGENGAEMTPFGSGVGASITAALGSGRF